MTFESLNREVDKKHGAYGWPAGLAFKATEGDSSVEVVIRDTGSAKDDVWKRIDPWGFAFFDKAKAIANEIPTKPLHLTFSLRCPGTPLAECQYEALKRRVSYLAEANHLQIALLKGDSEDRLYTFEELTKRPDTETVRSDYPFHHIDDTPGRLEKDFQKWLDGWGLPDRSDPNILQTNERLALFGDDFVRIGKVKSGKDQKGYKVEREFPTGVFNKEVNEGNRILSTEFVDLVTFNKHGDLAVIEIKFDDPQLEVIPQVLNYALFFHSYREKLDPLLDIKLGRQKGWTAKRKLVTYLVSNAFHNRFKSVWPYYSQPGHKHPLAIRQVIMGHMPDTERAEAA